jgi:hypothetical protein
MNTLKPIDDRIEMLTAIRRNLRADTPAEVCYALQDQIDDLMAERVKLATEEIQK